VAAGSCLPMRYHRLHVLGGFAVAGACAWAGVSGAAQVPITGPDDPMTVVGTLTCSLTAEAENASGDTTSMGLGREVQCSFQAGRLGPEEIYVGSVQGVGKTQVLFGRGAVILSVKAPASTNMAPGLLSQSYAVDAASGGNALAPLVGERNKAIMLQPLAEEEGRVAKGKSQPDAVLIVVELKLKASPA
jgi:hypothetical protein